MKKFNKFKNELREFVNTEFMNEKYFCIIYGSFCYGVGTLNSDVDLAIVSENVSMDRAKRVASKVRKLHKKFNMALDDEVPHEVKSLSDFKTLDLALKGRGFESSGKITIPPIVKSKIFLKSKAIKMRLLLNALTSKCIFVCGDFELFEESKEKSMKNLVRLIFSYAQMTSTTPKSFVKKIIGTKKKNGEDFLGYKDNRVVKAYLIISVENMFNKLVSEGRMRKVGKRYFVDDRRWFEEIVW